MPRTNPRARSTAPLAEYLAGELDKPFTHPQVLRGYIAADHDLGADLTLAIDAHRLPAAEVTGR